MRILLDENIPVDLAADLGGHQVDTVVGAGWAGVTNGELLQRASGQYSALLTMDRNLQHQQKLSELPFGVLVLRAPSNRLVDLRPLIPEILDALRSLRPGEVRALAPTAVVHESDTRQLYCLLICSITSSSAGCA